MDRHTIQAAKQLSLRIVRQAGRIAKERFGRVMDLNTKDEHGDVVTEVDYLAEELIIQHIRSAFPTHQIHSEEAGNVGPDSDWLWLIDPLDGTNNYAIGLPVFTASITLMYRKEPVLGVVYEPMSDRLFVSVIGEGTTCNDQPIHIKSNPNQSKWNIGWIQGHNVQNDASAVRLRHLLDIRVRRMMRLWAPTLVWCMLANGDIDGIVLYNSEGDDLYSGILMVKEAGGVVIDFDGSPFTGMKDEPYLIACHPDHQQQLLQLVREGLN